MSRWRWTLVALGGVVTVVALAFAVHAALEHDRARATWQREADRLPNAARTLPAPPLETQRAASPGAPPSEPPAPQLQPRRAASPGAPPRTLPAPQLERQNAASPDAPPNEPPAPQREDRRAASPGAPPSEPPPPQRETQRAASPGAPPNEPPAPQLETQNAASPDAPPNELPARQHEDRRAASAAGSVGPARYDPARSDALYREVRALRDRARHASWLAAFGTLLALVPLGIRRPIEARRPAPRRAWLALLVDSALLASAVALLTLLVESLGIAHAGFGALLLALGASSLVGATVASLARGASLAMHLLGVRAVHRGHSPGLLRALLALALAPLALLTTPIALLRPRASPLHLRLAGLRVTHR